MSEKGVIFDLDGVLVDTAKYHYLGWKRLADELGVPFDEARNERLKGVSRRDSLILLLGRTPSEPEIKEWCDRKNGYYLQYIGRIDRRELLPGSLEIVQALRKEPGWKLAIASASKNTKLILNRLDIMPLFDAVVDGHDFERTKPDPEVFQKAAARLRLPPERLVVVEDAEAGVRAAKTAGMRAVGLGRPDVLGAADLVVPSLAHVTPADFERLLS